MIPRHNVSILCVDDDASIRRMLERVLVSGGFSPALAEDGFEALTRVNRNPQAFQLVITDLRMPRLDGFGLIEKARAAGYTGDFIVLAGMISNDDRMRLNDLRVSSLIQKPARPAALLDAVRMVQVR